MKVSVKVKPSPGLLTRLGSLSKLEAVKEGAEWTYDYLHDYHIAFANKWRGSNYMAGPKSGQFWQDIVKGWQKPVVNSSRGAKIINTNSLLGWKVTGGTITVKRAKFLTIPLIPEAKGLSVAEFVIASNTRLFKAGNALCRTVGKKLEAVYALKKSVYQAPWPGAMPPQDKIQEVFMKGVQLAINRALK